MAKRIITFEREWEPSARSERKTPLAKMLTEARIEKSLSAKEVAEAIGYSSAAGYSALEYGLTNLNLSKLYPLCETLGLDIEDVVKAAAESIVGKGAPTTTTKKKKKKKKKKPRAKP